MSQVKFRAWEPILKQFVYVGLSHGRMDLEIISHRGNPPISELLEWEQCIGLTDSNNVEIYKGDIFYVGSELIPVEDEDDYIISDLVIREYYMVLGCDDDLINGWLTTGMYRQSLASDGEWLLDRESHGEWDDGDFTTHYVNSEHLEESEVVGNRYQNSDLMALLDGGAYETNPSFDK